MLASEKSVSQAITQSISLNLPIDCCLDVAPLEVRVLRLELTDKVREPQLRQVMLRVVHDRKVRLVLVEVLLRDEELVVAQPNPEHLVHQDSQWLRRWNEHDESKIELAAMVQHRIVQVLAGDLGARVGHAKQARQIVGDGHFLVRDQQPASQFESVEGTHAGRSSMSVVPWSGPSSTA